MLSRMNRVTKKEFDEAIKRGRMFHSPFFLVWTNKAVSMGGAKISAVAPIKIAKTSPARHRIRRRIYEASRPYLKLMAKDSLAIVIAKQPVLKAGFEDIKTAIKDVFVKAGLLR